MVKGEWEMCRGVWCLFIEAEDGIRDVERSGGLEDVYKRLFSMYGALWG